MTAQATIPTQTTLPALPGSHAQGGPVAQTTPLSQASKADFSSLSDRMSYLLVLRLAIGAIVALWAVLRPDALGVSLETLGAWTVAYLLVAVAGEWARRRTTRFLMTLRLTARLRAAFLRAALRTTRLAAIFLASFFTFAFTRFMGATFFGVVFRFGFAALAIFAFTAVLIFEAAAAIACGLLSSIAMRLK